MNHKSMFTAGAVMLVAGTFALGMAAGGAAEAASYQTTAINYLAPWSPGNDRPCGFQVPGTADAKPVVRQVVGYRGQDLRICQMIVRIPR